MTARELSRRRLVLALALAVPAVFLAVAVLTTSEERRVMVQLAAAGPELVEAGERRQSLLFISIAAAGLIAAFLAAGLVQRQLDASRRLVLAGYQAAELIVGRLLVLLGVVSVTAGYTSGLLALVVVPPPSVGAIVGLFLAAFVYAAYGLLVGTIFRRDLEAVFAILVLVNVDAGWLQNPVYFATAESRWLIEALPAHAPAQTALVAELVGEPIGGLVVRSLAYGAALLGVAITIYSLRMRVAR